MDQAVQVDFPVISKRIRRHYTSTDLLNNGHHRSTNNSIWHHQRTLLGRPKSLPLNQDTNLHHHSRLSTPFSHSLPLQTFNSHNHHYQHHNQHYNHNFLTPPISEAGMSRDRTPPPSHSPNSTIILRPSTFLEQKLNHNIDETNKLFPLPAINCDSNNSLINNNNNDNNQSKCSCQNLSANEELSWRRLHLSRAKLKATATTSELLSGFAMIAMVELQINEKTKVPQWLLVTFAVCTTILVSVHIFALMISTYILPNIDAIAKLEIYHLINESPHEQMRKFIELAWAFSTVLGLFLFLVEVAILCWVKFLDYSFTAAAVPTIIVIPVLITFVCFAIHFYHSLVVYKCNRCVCDLEKLESIKKQLDDVPV